MNGSLESENSKFFFSKFTVHSSYIKTLHANSSMSFYPVKPYFTMSFNPTSQQVIELSRKTNLPMRIIRAAMIKLGHCDERLVIGYINAISHAVIRNKTNDEIAEYFRLPSDTPITPPEKDY